jgi:hypothetical protein
MSVLVEHMAALRQRFIAEHGKAPTVLAIGRWDARELARFAAPLIRNMDGELMETTLRPSELLRLSRAGKSWLWDAEVKVDGRIGRMPGALWWHA